MDVGYMVTSFLRVTVLDVLALGEACDAFFFIASYFATLRLKSN